MSSAPLSAKLKSMSKRVWVLGAGFGRPLGGPLFDDLMRPETKTHLAAHFKDGPFTGPSAGIYGVILQIYAYGSAFKHGTPRELEGRSGELIWNDAEQFLGYLDTAADAGPESSQFRQLARIINSYVHTYQHQSLPPFNTAADARRVASAAKRIVAGWCSAFLVGANQSTEAWAPFRKWAAGLCADDTIITFNYDRVVELLNERAQTVSVVLPGQGVAPSNQARLLKLHGSVDWKLRSPSSNLPSATRVVEPQPDPLFAITCADDELAIASPGPAKLAASTGVFAELWDLAEAALQQADVIVFIGYRFPPSDSYARDRLLGAIGRNTSGNLRVHAVLGPPSEATSRLETLVKAELSRRPAPLNKTTPQHYRDHKLYGEDFLSACPALLSSEPTPP